MYILFYKHYELCRFCPNTDRRHRPVYKTTVVQETVLEFSPCNDWQTCPAGITQLSNLPMRRVLRPAVLICRSLHNGANSGPA